MQRNAVQRGGGRASSHDSLLEVDDLRTVFETRRGTVRAVDGVSLTVGSGECLGIVGESGSGKSALALSILGLLNPPGKIASGKVMWKGRDLVRLRSREMRRVRGKEIAMIFQDPLSSLNPVLSVGFQVDEATMAHASRSRKAARIRTAELLTRVGIPTEKLESRTFPHQLSGGMRQRVCIGMAMANRPDLLIADEPTTALDTTIQAQIIGLLRQLKDEFRVSIMLITHNLGLVAGLCDRVVVMYAGKVVEEAETRALFARPRHPYTKALLRCVPRLDADLRDELYNIPGAPPDLLHVPAGCRFRDRCESAFASCVDAPVLEDVQSQAGMNSSVHRVACWLERGQ